MGPFKNYLQNYLHFKLVGNAQKVEFQEIKSHFFRRSKVSIIFAKFLIMRSKVFDIFQKIDSSFDLMKIFVDTSLIRRLKVFFFNNYWCAPFGYLYFHFLYVIASIAYIHPVYGAGV